MGVGVMKQGEDQGKEIVTLELWRTKSQWKAKIKTQHVSLKQNVEEKVLGKDPSAVWDDVNWWNEEEVWKSEMRGPGGLKSAYLTFSS